MRAPSHTNPEIGNNWVSIGRLQPETLNAQREKKRRMRDAWHNGQLRYWISSITQRLNINHMTQAQSRRVTWLIWVEIWKWTGNIQKWHLLKLLAPWCRPQPEAPGKGQLMLPSYGNWQSGKEFCLILMAYFESVILKHWKMESQYST